MRNAGPAPVPPPPVASALERAWRPAVCELLVLREVVRRGSLDLAALERFVAAEEQRIRQIEPLFEFCHWAQASLFDVLECLGACGLIALGRSADTANLPVRASDVTRQFVATARADLARAAVEFPALGKVIEKARLGRA